MDTIQRVYNSLANVLGAARHGHLLGTGTIQSTQCQYFLRFMSCALREIILPSCFCKATPNIMSLSWICSSRRQVLETSQASLEALQYLVSSSIDQIRPHPFLVVLSSANSAVRRIVPQRMEYPAQVSLGMASC